MQKKQQNYTIMHKIRNGEPSAQNKKWRAKAHTQVIYLFIFKLD